MTKEVLQTDLTFMDKLVTLRMNKDFMTFIRKTKYQGDIEFIAGFDDTESGSTDSLWCESQGAEQDNRLDFYLC